MIDVAVIGAGPAGLSAAINVLQRNKTVEILGRSPKTSLLFAAENVDNYLGMQNVTGEELINSFYNHAIEKGAKIRECKVSQIMPFGEGFMINIGDDIIQAKTIILALGISRGKTIENEENMIGKGVSYCATCDGMLYKNKTVVVIGDSYEAESDVNFLSELCSKVYYLPLYKEEINVNDSVEIIRGKAEKVLGNDVVSGIMIDGKEINCDGIFFIKQSIPLKSLINGLEIKNGSVVVDRDMQTNIKGIFAAGDCTGKPYQISKAVGEGLIAGQNAVRDV